MAPDAPDVLAPGLFVCVASEFRAPQHLLQLGEQCRARDDDDPVVGERAHDGVRRGALSPMSAEMNTPGSITTRIKRRRAHGAQCGPLRTRDARPRPPRDASERGSDRAVVPANTRSTRARPPRHRSQPWHRELTGYEQRSRHRDRHSPCPCAQPVTRRPDSGRPARLPSTLPEATISHGLSCPHGEARPDEPADP
jgi:hypothetical protein